MQNDNFKNLEAELKKAIQGEVRFDNGSRALYATDASNYRQVPIGVVIPKNQNDIIATVALCHKYKVPLLSRGGGTSLAGQCCNVAVVMDMSKYMNEIIELDYENKTAIVQPGLVLDTLRDAAEKRHLTFAPDPATHTHCTLGGMMGNNSCGVHSVMGGKTDANVLELDILTYDGLRMKVGPTSKEDLEQYVQEGGRKGEIYSKLKKFMEKYSSLIEQKFPKIPRCVSGYNLPWLLEKNGFDVAKALIGSESTCVTILEAKVKLIHSPPVRSLLVLGYPDIYVACDHIMEIMQHGPTALEGMDKDLIDDMIKKKMHPSDIKILPAGEGWLLIEFGGERKEESDAKAKGLMEALKTKTAPPSMKLFDDKESEKHLWKVREGGLGATARIPGEGDTWPGWEDSAVPPEKTGNYLRELRKLLEKHGYKCALYGHFGQGCIHTRIDFDLYTAEGLENYRSFLNEAAHLVVSFGGSLSGEHGDGQARAALHPIMFGDELVKAFEEFKAIWDPEWKMNPGKLTRAYKPTDKLRISPDYNPPVLKTHFKFLEESGEGGFARATTLCVGVGECRRYNQGTMCPSYMVTKEEKDSTRGRARLLFEMLQGTVIGKKMWKDEAVKDALDLCLACKGCKGECPMTVDMATYKAEFLSHYYEGRLRPRSAYAFGLISWWAKLASYMPNFVNFLTHAPVLSSVGKWLSGTAPERTIPRFADKTFRAWFDKRVASKEKKTKKVILWADTFNNYFHPEVAKAAVEVLEHLGFEVAISGSKLCCGRPLYDYGMLDQAKKLLVEILTTMKQDIVDETPIIGLEPSCVTVFRDELCNLFPRNKDAQRLKGQTYLFSEFLVKYAKESQFKQLKRKALVQGHCHHKSFLKFEDEKEVLKKLGLDFEILESGCCGMAGGFGFEKQHYDISIQIGERVLIPAVKKSSAETLIIANGFSCREQILQTTGREVYHLAEVVRMAIE